MRDIYINAIDDPIQLPLNQFEEKVANNEFVPY